MRVLTVIAALLAAAGGVMADNVSARAGIAANSVFVGEPVRFQIQVSGSESPERPDLSNLEGFQAQFVNDEVTSRTSVQFVNGRSVVNKQLSYVFTYELRATKEGRLTIPAIAVKVGDQTVRTQPLAVTAQKPSETENYKLRLSFSKERVYVGEQFVLEAVFYFRGRVDRLNIAIPFLEEEGIEVYDLDTEQPDNATELLDGQRFQTGRLRKVIVPTQPGELQIEPATLSFRGQDGFEVVRNAFGRSVRQPKIRNFVIPSNPLDLTVLPLPTVGQPANFAGHVGEYSLSVQASPTEVNVGDPITLNIAVTGPPFLEPVELPPLHKQESLTRDFKVPEDIADGSVNGNFKLFTQTIRATHDDVSEIPPLELAYFDTAQGAYEVARTQPIAITVRPTRIVTAGDVEGAGPISAAQQELQSWVQGIAHNYGGAEALSRQVLGFGALATPGRLALIAGPPLLYAILLGAVVAARRRHANPDSIRAKRAASRFNRDIGPTATAEEVLAVFCGYLGDKLAMSSEALTYRDVEERLRKRGVDDEALSEIRKLFTAGEASRFAGGSGGAEGGGARERASALVKELEKTLR